MSDRPTNETIPTDCVEERFAQPPSDEGQTPPADPSRSTDTPLPDCDGRNDAES